MQWESHQYTFRNKDNYSLRLLSAFRSYAIINHVVDLSDDYPFGNKCILALNLTKCNTI